MHPSEGTGPALESTSRTGVRDLTGSRHPEGAMPHVIRTRPSERCVTAAHGGPARAIPTSTTWRDMRKPSIWRVVVTALIAAGLLTTELPMILNERLAAAEPDCRPPSSWPSHKSWVILWNTAAGHSGASSACPRVGQVSATTDPRYVWCRRRGDEVGDARGNFNHWWLWTDLDTGGRGWISAYYIAGQDNDQADDIRSHTAIPECPPSGPPAAPQAPSGPARPR